MFQAEKGANAIPGYTGFIPSQDYDQDLLQIQGNRNHIPNYAGFVPGIKSENLFGKTFGKLLYFPAHTNIIEGIIPIFNSRSDLPADIRYKSEVKEAYCDQRDQRGRDINLYGKLDSETSKALAYTLSNLTHFEQTNTLPKRSDSRDRQSNLTYEEALQKLK